MKIPFNLVSCLFVWLSTLTVGSASASDWLQFRGPEGKAVAPENAGPFPRTLDPGASIAWRADLPGRGLGSPIVVGDQVFVTAASGPEQDVLHVLCFDAKSGELRWERRFWATGRTMTHGKTNVAAPTPCSDGQRVFAYFSSNDVLCLDLEGTVLWLRGLTLDYANASNSLGLASSPVVADGTLIVQSENDSESFTAGLSVEDGRNLWKLERPKAANWTSPILVGGPSWTVALQSSRGLLGVDPASGATRWEYAAGASTIPSSVAAPDGTVYVPSFGITALRPEQGTVQPTQLWRNEQIGPGTGSPIVMGDRVYVINRAGVLSASDRFSGERLWRVRLEGPFSGSPVGWNETLYVVSERGLLQVVDVSGEEGQTIATLDLGTEVLCTPALAANAVFLRNDAALWKVVEPAE